MSDSRGLSGYFDRSTALVHDGCSQFEERYARPAYKNMKQYFEERPIVSTFVTIFTLLSLAPVASFIGAALFVFLTLTLTSFLLASLAAVAVILALFTLLVLVLFGILLASIFLTGAALSSYSLLRFALHVQREGPSTGAWEWRQETRDTFLSRKPAAKEERLTSNGSSKNIDSTAAANKNGPTENQQAGGAEDEKPKTHGRDGNGEAELTKKEAEKDENVSRNSYATPDAGDTDGGFEVPGTE